MDEVTLYFNSTFLHFTQLITGLEYLNKRGKIVLKYKMELGRYPLDLCKIEYNGTVVFFDLSDSSMINRSIYDQCDFYVKRMLLHEDFELSEKLLPFGLNYQVFYNNNYLKWSFLRNRKMIKYSLRYSDIASFGLNIKDCIRHNNLSKMESGPANGSDIIFRSRLWDPDNNEVAWKKEERRKINNERIGINRILNEEYGNNFKGGIQKDELSLRICSDLILPEKDYHKRNYVRTLKDTSIGIVSQGLENSISWKFGEYVAHSMAILSSPIEKYKLLGDFREGKNYLVYHNIDECHFKVNMLISDDKLRRNMQMENQKYYDNILHPGMKMMNIFQDIKERL